MLGGFTTDFLNDVSTVIHSGAFRSNRGLAYRWQFYENTDSAWSESRQCPSRMSLQQQIVGTGIVSIWPQSDASCPRQGAHIRAICRRPSSAYTWLGSTRLWRSSRFHRVCNTGSCLSSAAGWDMRNTSLQDKQSIFWRRLIVHLGYVNACTYANY